MNRFKRFFKRIGFGLAALVGIQYARPPVVEDHTPPIVVVQQEVPHEDTPTGKPFMMIESITGTTADESKMIVRAVDIANEVMASECFKNRILKTKFTETNGLSNEQIFQKLAKNAITIDVEMFEGDWWDNYFYKVVGIDKGTGVVFMNRFFVKDVLTAASLSIHEAEGHGQGFTHYGTHLTSVPYQMNRIFEECAEALGIKE